MKRFALWLIPAALVIGCSSSTVPPASEQPQEDQTPPASEPAPTAPSVQEDLATAAEEAVNALKERDMERLAALVHPTKGLRFTPYAYVVADPNGDLVFTADQVKNLMQDESAYTWGMYDGSGAPLSLTFADYCDQFIYDHDFAQIQPGPVNTIIGQGNTVNNIREAYPEGQFVEYHYPGTAENDHADWSSLRLVFEQVDGLWYLVGIVHDQWTI